MNYENLFRPGYIGGLRIKNRVVMTAMGNGLAAHYDAYEEDEVYRFLDEGVPALLAEGEVYLTDASAVCRPHRRRSRWGCRCTAACSTLRWTRGSSRWES